MLSKEQKAEWDQMKTVCGLYKIEKELDMKKEREKDVMNKYRVQINHEWEGDQTDQLIILGTAYLDALDNLDEDNPESVSSILNTFYCIHPDSGYHFGIYIEEPWEHEAPSHQCDQAWFHCYQGEEEPIMIRPYERNSGGLCHLGNMCYLRFTFDFFNHLTIDTTAMGFWQVYLLSIGKTLLPFSGQLYYTKRKLILAHEQLKNISLPFQPERIPELMNLDTDVSPSVQIKDNQAIVSCCFWNDWGGLIQESAKITFLNGKVYLLEDFDKQVLFKYDCGIRY